MIVWISFLCRHAIYNAIYKLDFLENQLDLYHVVCMKNLEKCAYVFWFSSKITIIKVVILIQLFITIMRHAWLEINVCLRLWRTFVHLVKIYWNKNSYKSNHLFEEENPFLLSNNFIINFRTFCLDFLYFSFIIFFIFKSSLYLIFIISN